MNILYTLTLPILCTLWVCFIIYKGDKEAKRNEQDRDLFI